MKFIRPNSLEEVLCILSEGDVKLLAGGTDVVPGIHQNSSRFRNINTLCAISHLSELKYITKEDSLIRIGGAVTITEISENKILNSHMPLLSKAASFIGSVQIRNRATIAGNFVNNAPCADTVPPLLVYDTVIKIKSLSGSREVLLREFLLAPYQTQLAPGEIVTEIIIPIIPESYKGDFYKLGRRHGVSVSRISFAVMTLAEGNKFSDIRIASGAVTPIGMRFRELEDFVKCRELNRAFIKELAVEFGKEIIARTGMRWSSPYKIPTARQMFYNTILKLNPWID